MILIASVAHASGLKGRSLLRYSTLISAVETIVQELEVKDERLPD